MADPDIDWETCIEDSCVGVRLPSGGKCWAHANTADLDAALQQLDEDGRLDARGVPVTPQLADRLLAAAPNYNQGYRVLTDAWFDRASFQDTAEFDEVTFIRAAQFSRTSLHDDAVFIGAHFHGDAHFDRATFDSEVEGERLRVALQFLAPELLGLAVLSIRGRIKR